MATVNLSDYKPLNITNAEDFSIGIVFSEWNDFVTYNLRDAALEILEKEGVKAENIKQFSVPGAFELNYANRFSRNRQWYSRFDVCFKSSAGLSR